MSLTYYCESPDCKSKNKIIKTLEQNISEHGHHLAKYKTFDELRMELQEDDHPLGEAQT